MEQKLLQQGISAVLIAGPTASGKSALALEMARQHGGEIVNADSMQVYGVLDRLTARPDAQDLDAVPHHLYGHVPPQSAYSTGIWVEQATDAIAGIRARGALPIVVGGTGLYFRALTGGLSDMPTIPAAIRDDLRARLESEGIEPLSAELARLDPGMAERLRPADRQRILRALEVILATGRSIAEFQGQGRPAIIDPSSARCLVLEPPRPLLHARINTRFGKMIQDGALEEVERLLALDVPPQHPAMKAIGVSQLAQYLAGHLSLEQAVELARAATRQYAKRQMTWFRNQLDQDWVRLMHDN
ncbi:tRNA (adenosine(37)-N6)-dimethylallyltransferase MiaA [Hoeflea sp. YIM 152468]|uniref:tRNA (adenosine(37)-N6)-dimethylallyltransferase MiaA n=1 Tax=Hoeflea sp. YIM 152468 TaxID=3031759 RepID=UPI0023D9B5B6|nr:tRNA (adenosine(37)-N6)-dimethylallyltransferase MiaA [Hoeflea sp. YIM 152468]MDF1608445.1 tRNA (adenosine(37)-N6)-dimethylallyltransferase MiaA [Hoeflea sp. YIM 152468]